MEPILDLEGVHHANQKKANADLLILRDPMVLFPHAPDARVPLSVDWTQSGVRRAAQETQLPRFLTMASAPRQRVCGNPECRIPCLGTPLKPIATARDPSNLR